MVGDRLAIMRLARSLRRCLSGTLVLVLLFAQLATAAYACPAVSPVERAQAASMPCIGSMENGTLQSMDPDQAALCFEHCKAGAHAVDAGHALAVAAPAPSPVLVVAALADDAAVLAPSWASHARTRERTRPVTHSVLHCCWRI
jgi:hypothetical protein